MFGIKTNKQKDKHTHSVKTHILYPPVSHTEAANGGLALQERGGGGGKLKTQRACGLQGGVMRWILHEENGFQQ